MIAVVTLELRGVHRPSHRLRSEWTWPAGPRWRSTPSRPTVRWWRETDIATARTRLGLHAS